MSRQAPSMNNLDILDTLQKVDILTVVKLKEIARSIGLAMSGRKLDLQERIKLFFHNGLRSNDYLRIMTVRTLILKLMSDQVVPDFQTLYLAIQNNTFQVDVSNQYSSAGSGVHSNTALSRGVQDTPRPWLYFKESPFYRLKRLLHGTPVLARRAPDTRGNCSLTFVLNESETSLLNSGDQYHLLLLSGAYDGVSSSEALLQFPNPLEIHFNGTIVKDNVKGIKNKPGTAKPADLTKYLQKSPSQNKLDLVYAFAKTDYLMFCYIVEMVSPETLFEKILNQPHILKVATLKEIQREQDEEDDLVEMQEVITLKCPLTYSKLKYPAKSLYCKHIQCFDALSFLQLQEQTPTWSCPICQKNITVKTLAIDDYLYEVIKATKDSDEAIEINHDGTWNLKTLDEGRNGNGHLNDTDESDSEIQPKSESHDIQMPKSSSRPPEQTEVIEIVSLDSSDDEEEVVPDVLDTAAANLPTFDMTARDDSTTDEEWLPHTGAVQKDSMVIHELNETTPSSLSEVGFNGRGQELEDFDEEMNSLFEEIENEVSSRRLSQAISNEILLDLPVVPSALPVISAERTPPLGAMAPPPLPPPSDAPPPDALSAPTSIGREANTRHVPRILDDSPDLSEDMEVSVDASVDQLTLENNGLVTQQAEREREYESKTLPVLDSNLATPSFFGSPATQLETHPVSVPGNNIAIPSILVPPENTSLHKDVAPTTQRPLPPLPPPPIEEHTRDIMADILNPSPDNVAVNDHHSDYQPSTNNYTSNTTPVRPSQEYPNSFQPLRTFHTGSQMSKDTPPPLTASPGSLPLLPSFASQIPSWGRQTLLRLSQAQNPDNVGSFHYSPSRFGRSGQVRDSAPQAGRHLSFPLTRTQNVSTVQQSEGVEFPPVVGTVRRALSTTEPSETNSTPAKRVNLGFSIHGQILPSFTHRHSETSLQQSMRLGSSPSQANEGPFISNGSNGGIRDPSSAFVSPMGAVLPTELSTLSQPKSVTKNGPNVNHSPRRFLPVQPSTVTYSNSTPSKRSLDVVDLVSSDDEDDIPLAKR